MVSFWEIVKNKIHVIVFVFATLFLLVFPDNTKIWFDEVVSVLLSKGIKYHSVIACDESIVNSAELAKLNNPRAVFDKTILDNSNSFLYNIILHFFTRVFGNTLFTYVLLSKLFAAGTLAGFFFLCTRIIKRPIFIALATCFLLIDPVFWGMSLEVRAYTAGMFFVTMAAVFLYKFIYERDSQRNFLFIVILSFFALLTHYLTVYVLLCYVIILFAKKGKSLFSRKYIVALWLPTIFFGIYFYAVYHGIQLMSKTNEKLTETASEAFTAADTFFTSIYFASAHLKLLVSLYPPYQILRVFAFLILLIMYFAGRKITEKGRERELYTAVFFLALSATFFLTVLSIVSGHGTPFGFRYYAFCIPFNCLFLGVFFELLFRKKVNMFLRYGLLAVVIIPSAFLFASGLVRPSSKYSYNHPEVAQIISDKKLTDVVVGNCADINLLHGFLPEGYSLIYHVDLGTKNFTAYNDSISVSIPIVRR